MSDSVRPLKNRDLIVTRRFDATVEQVWKTWIDPDLLKRWWGPDMFTCPFCKLDFRVGGTSVVCMRSPQGMDFFSMWVYQKIVPMQRIEFIQNMSDQDGNRIDPAKLGLPPEFPQDTRVVVVFTSVGDQTEMTMTQYNMPPPDIQIGKYAEMGLNQSIDKMAAIFSKR